MKGLRKISSRFHGMFWQQFLLTVGVVLLALLLLGASFYALSYNHTLTEKRSEMESRANLIAQMSASYLVKDDKAAQEDDSVDKEGMLRSLAGVATEMSGVDYFICDATGNVVLTSNKSLEGQTITVSESIMQEVLQGNGTYEGKTTLGYLYENEQFVTGVPIVKGERKLGVALAVMDSSELTKIWRSFISIFLMTASIVLLVAFAASFLMSMRQTQPISEMVEATRAFADGNLDVRIHEGDRHDEIGELASSFNQMADALAQTERQRRDFIANISHELKTPMTSIAGYTDGILDGTIPPESQRQYLQIISDESRRLSRLVRRMLDVSQIQSQELKKEEFDLCESMRLALLSMEQKITERGLDVDVDIPDDSVMVLGDRDLITQVIYNLLENAAKFAAPESQLFLGLSTLGEKAMVSVRNTGNTIPAEELPLLFERFHKTDKSRSEDKDSYGLGLYVVKTILDHHKEKIYATSKDGVTTFIFSMQIVHQAAAPGALAAARREK